MTDEVKIEMEEKPSKTVMKAKGGWPKGKPRMNPAVVKAKADAAEKPKNDLISKMKARPNWDTGVNEQFGTPEEIDRLKIPEEKLDALRRDGVALQWVTRSVRGMEVPGEISKMARGGWTPVHQSDFGGILDGVFMGKGTDDVIGVGDCMLVARPVEIDNKARMLASQESQSPVKRVRDRITRGMDNVSGSDHPSATSKNHIKITRESIQIPTEGESW